MNPTDAKPEAVFYVDWLMPLSQANRRRRVAYLARGSEGESLWRPVVSRSGGCLSLAPENCTIPALLGALDAYWRRSGATDLNRLTPELRRLVRIMEAGGEAARDDGVVAEFVYPLY
jgi:hypothetical protein